MNHPGLGVGCRTGRGTLLIKAQLLESLWHKSVTGALSKKKHEVTLSPETDGLLLEQRVASEGIRKIFCASADIIEETTQDDWQCSQNTVYAFQRAIKGDQMEVWCQAQVQSHGHDWCEEEVRLQGSCKRLEGIDDRLKGSSP